MKRQYQGQIPPFGLRLQPFLKQKIEESSKRNCRSQNMEIHVRLERSFEAEEKMERETASAE